VTIDTLPDIVLLEVFDFYVDKASMEAWHTLVHVCRKWRNIVFGSPRRLNLQLSCGTSTRVRKMLDTWPPLPIFLIVLNFELWSTDDVSAALEHKDRIHQLDLFSIPSSLSKKVLSAIQQPFPSIVHLGLAFQHETTPVEPELLLGGSAPHLLTLSLNRMSVPGLPTILLSATHLVRLELWGIPPSGYISPEAMTTCLSVLTRLEGLDIDFKSPRGRPDQKSQRPAPQTRILLPVLTEWHFKGVSEYLEVLVARIDAPLLNYFVTTFFHELLVYTP
jgi:hypothetical protein